MGALTEYVEEGLALAIALANRHSTERQGTAAGPSHATAGVVLRVSDPVVLDEMAAHLREVLAAPRPDQAGPLINQLFRAHHAAPELAPDVLGHWRLHLHPRGASREALDMVKAASGLAWLVDGGRWQALKDCLATRCDDYFLDLSPGTTRRYCSRTCANRVNSHLHRRRHPTSGNDIPSP